MNNLQKKTTTTNSNILIESIDTKPIIENGESPTAIILSIAILLVLVFSSLTVMILTILVSTK